MCTTTKAETTRAILAHLVEYPDAADTFEGIVEWWLLEQQIRERMALVQAALADLVADRLVIERTREDSRIHFRINHRRIAEIRTLIGE